MLLVEGVGRSVDMVEVVDDEVGDGLVGRCTGLWVESCGF